ncbi:MAG TPA: SRPBCC family protein [Solirubrobacteraceae bacterium]|jgi:uncharacterized protein YndB with AHSA1/START domain|nr:SRPBCC family protein [Solirubrobacteraceae bacterium]
MPKTRRTRTIGAPLEEVWALVSDPHHLPRWWPRVVRVEAVEGGAFTEVMRGAKGRDVRADFELVQADGEAGRIVWSQRLEGSAFARLLSSAETEVRLEGTEGGTGVTIELRQALRGFFPRVGSLLVRRAAGATIEEALDGLERIVG